jgi:hypothetical protein
MNKHLVGLRGRDYTPPALSLLGSVHEQTQQDKTSGLSDGIMLLTVGPLTNASG